MADRAAAAKFVILRQIYDLAREQREALERDQLETFQRILDERDDLIARLNIIQNGDEDAVELPPNVVAFPGSSGAEAEDVMALDAVIRGILDYDRANETSLAAMMAEIRETLPELAHGQRAAAAYRIVTPASTTIDRPA